MIKVFLAEPIFREKNLPESIFDKIEALDLKRALNPAILPVVELSDEEYLQIAPNILTSTIGITTSAFYGVPAYYSVMPQDIFDALELAALNDEATTMVSKTHLDKMLADYKIKMNCVEK